MVNNDSTFYHAIEQTLLSSILYKNENLTLFLKEGLIYNDFSHFKHREIFKIMVDLYNRNYEINELTICKENIELESLVLDIMTKSAVENGITYIKDLKDYKLKNDVLKGARQLLSKSDLNGRELFAELIKLSSDEIQKPDLISIKPLDDVEDKDIEILCENFVKIIKRTVTLFTAKGGVGKTYLLLMIALHYQLEQIKNKTYKKCFCWFSEDDPSIIKKRKRILLNAFFSPEDRELLLSPKYKNLLQISENLPFYFMYVNHKKTFSVDENFILLKNRLKDYELVILDPLASFLGINENDNALGKAFMDLLVNWAKTDDKALAVIHHAPGDKIKARGAEAFRDTAKLHYLLDNIRKDGKIVKNSKSIIATVDKDNYNMYGVGHEMRLKIFPDNKNQGQERLL